jgi:hypothetical protein
MSAKSISAVVLTDVHTNDPGSYVNPLVCSVLDRLSQRSNICVSDDYFTAVPIIKSVQDNYDAIVVFLRSGQLFKHPGLFAEFRKPVVVIEHDAYQNSLEWHSRYRAWTDYFRTNPVAALCVSGNQALHDLRGKIPGIVKRIAKAAPASFLQSRINRSGRYCVFGTVEFEVYTERKSVFESIQPYTVYDRIMRKWSLYKTSYFLSRIRRKVPDISRIDFPYPRMPHVLKYYSAAIICDRGLREPMMKHFEVAALGLVPFRDDECEEELGEHGYHDGESMVLYRDVDELREKMRFYGNHPSLLNRIQEQAREVTRVHTWERRADELIRFLVTEVI